MHIPFHKKCFKPHTNYTKNNSQITVPEKIKFFFQFSKFKNSTLNFSKVSKNVGTILGAPTRKGSEQCDSGTPSSILLRAQAFTWSSKLFPLLAFLGRSNEPRLRFKTLIPFPLPLPLPLTSLASPLWRIGNRNLWSQWQASWSRFLGGSGSGTSLRLVRAREDETERFPRSGIFVKRTLFLSLSLSLTMYSERKREREREREEYGREKWKFCSCREEGKVKITVMVLFTRVPPARSDGLVLVGAE